MTISPFAFIVWSFIALQTFELFDVCSEVCVSVVVFLLWSEGEKYIVRPWIYI